MPSSELHLLLWAVFVDLSSRWCWRANRCSDEVWDVCGRWNYPQSFTWPPVPLYCTHLVSTLGLISLRLNWAIEHILDLVIILYLALFPLSFLPFVCFLTFPFRTIWRKIRTESIYTSPPPLISLSLSHTHPLFYLSVSFVYERSLVFITKWGSDHDLPWQFDVY